MPVYAKKVSTEDRQFVNRETVIVTTNTQTKIPVPDAVVLCNGCNKNIYPDDGYLVYLNKWDLKRDMPYDIYCDSCVKKYFPKAITVED